MLSAEIQVTLIHGFLGQREDWDELITYLPKDLKIHAINLPGHAGMPISADSFFSLKKAIGKSTFLVGYSAGGRIALALKQQFPEDFHKLILISTHPGLKGTKKRAEKWKQDLMWIEQLKHVHFENFLQKWYEQPLFHSLKANTNLFTKTLLRRKTQHPENLATFLHLFSLGKTPCKNLPKKTIFICGEQDLKYVSLYHTLPSYIKVYTVAKAGHAVHLENPKRCAEIIKGEIDDYNGIF